MAETDKLVACAVAAKARALALYSNFRVGAAVETAAGEIFDGCNIESSSYGLSCCAERVALYKALSAGKRQFRRLVVAADTAEFCTPCGACRQVLWDYAREIAVTLVNAAGETRVISMKALLPEAFDDRLL